LRVVGCRLWERLSKIKARGRADRRRRTFAGFGSRKKVGGGLEAGDAGLEPGDVPFAMSVGAAGCRAVMRVATVGVSAGNTAINFGSVALFELAGWGWVFRWMRRARERSS
jgi:hypothetical protein